MDEKQIKNIWQFIRLHPFQFISTILILFGICWGANAFLYSETISSKINLIETKDSIIESKNSIIESKDLKIDEINSIVDNKNEVISELRNEILKNDLKNSNLDISINNFDSSNNNQFWNWTCVEKDVVIDELANKINEQEISLNICNQNINNLSKKNINLSEENNLLKDKVGIEKDFLENEFQIYNFKSKEFENGNFAITIKSIFSGKTSIRINGADFNDLTRGSLINFSYGNSIYNLRINEINDNCQSSCYSGETNRNIKIRIYE